jgi:hypothetical protein
MNGLLVTGDHKILLQKNYLSIDIRDFMETSNNWDKGEIDNIWWQVYKKSMKDFSRYRQQFIQKFAHSQVALNCHQNKYYSHKNPVCKACNAEIKTQHHILRCTACLVRARI